jgi:hypothetical protein
MTRAILRGRILLSSLRVEVAFLALLILTLLAIAFREPLLNRTLNFDAKSGNYTTRAYDDSNQGGNPLPGGGRLNRFHGPARCGRSTNTPIAGSSC